MVRDRNLPPRDDAHRAAPSPNAPQAPAPAKVIELRARRAPTPPAAPTRQPPDDGSDPGPSAA